MRNLKKLLAVIVTVCMLATFAIPAFADQSDSDICKELGMILGSGGGVTAEYLATQPTRLQGAIMFLRLKALEDEAKAFIVTGENFSDLEGLNETNKAILGYLKAHPELGFVGIGDNKFAPLQLMTAKEYYKVLLVALGYEEGTDFTWANLLQFAASKGLIKLLDNDNFTVSDLCTGTVEALKATVKGGTDTLITILVENGIIAADKAKASGLYSPTAKALEIVSATADTLKVAKFVFNKELNKDTVKAANFTIDGTAVKDAKLLDDKKTVLVVLVDSVGQNKTKDIKVKDVKDTSGLTISEVTKKVTFIDTTIPSITGAIAKNAKTIIVSASEPMNAEDESINVFDDIKIDDSAIIASSSVDYAKNTITFHLTSPLSKGTHKIVISKMKDYAEYVAVDQTYNIDIPEDTTAPAIASAKVKSNTSVELSFNEDVDYLSLGEYKVNGNNISVFSQDKNDWSKITLTLGTALDIAATVEIKVEFKGQKDVVGNEVKDWTTYTFKIDDDTALPTVSGSIESDNDIVLTFDKAMTTNKGEIRFYESDGDLRGNILNLEGSYSTLAEWNSDCTKLTIKAATANIANADAMDIKVNIKNMKDASIRTNLLPETNITLKTNDKAAPTISPSFTVDDKVDGDLKDDIITFYFSEPVDVETAKNLSNYEVVFTAGDYSTAQPLSLYNDVSFSSVSSNGKEVSLKAYNIAAIANEKIKIKVYAIKDKAGNMMANTGNIVSKVAATGPNLSLVTAKATAKDTIELEFDLDERIGYFAPGAFILQKVSDGTFVANIVNATIDGTDKYKVKLKVGGDLGTTAADVELKLRNPDLIKNVYGVKCTGTAGDITAVVDGIKPTITTDVKSKSIVLKFSELVNTTTSGLLSELLITKDGARVTVDPAKVTYYAGDIADANKVDDASTTGFNKVVIELEANKTYKVQFYANGSTQDLASTPNNVKDLSEAVTLTTLP